MGKQEISLLDIPEFRDIPEITTRAELEEEIKKSLCVQSILGKLEKVCHILSRKYLEEGNIAESKNSEKASVAAKELSIVEADRYCKLCAMRKDYSEPS